MTKTALVTGASEGIGQAIARSLAKDDFQITAVARNESKLKQFIQELGPSHRYVVADLSTEEGQNKIVNELAESSYNLLVNNAGIGVSGPFLEAPIEKHVAMINLNCIALVKLSYAFLKNAKSGDALVNVSSTLAFLPMPGIGLYSATKSLVTSFSESLWFEQKKRGIYVMALHPGITSTNFQVNSGGRTEDLPKGMAQTPEQVAEVVLTALRMRKLPSVISGAKNAIFAGISRILPRKSTVGLMGNMMKQ